MFQYWFCKLYHYFDKNDEVYEFVSSHAIFYNITWQLSTHIKNISHYYAKIYLDTLIHSDDMDIGQHCSFYDTLMDYFIWYVDSLLRHLLLPGTIIPTHSVSRTSTRRVLLGSKKRTTSVQNPESISSRWRTYVQHTKLVRTRLETLCLLKFTGYKYHIYLLTFNFLWTFKYGI